MKRRSLAALTTLAALPAAVIFGAAINTAVSTSAPAARVSAATYARFADTGNSGQPVTADVYDCHTMEVSMPNPNPGHTLTITINGSDGSHRFVSSNGSIVDNTFFTLQPSTTYTITPDGGDPITKSTPALLRGNPTSTCHGIPMAASQGGTVSGQQPKACQQARVPPP